MSHFTIENIEQVAKDEGVSVFYVISHLQAFAVESQDNETLEILCKIKSDLLGL